MNLKDPLIVNILGTVLITALGLVLLFYSGRNNRIHRVLASSHVFLSLPFAILAIIYIAEKAKWGIYQGPDRGILSSSFGPLAFGSAGFIVIVLLFVNEIKVALFASAFLLSLGLLGVLVVAEFWFQYLNYASYFMLIPLASIGVLSVTKNVNKGIKDVISVKRPISVVSAPRSSPPISQQPLPPTEVKPLQKAGPFLKNRYQIQHLLAEGGMAIILKGIDTQTGKEVCIKTNRMGGPNPDQYCLEKLKLETEMLKKCNHPNIVKHIDHFELPYRNTIRAYLVLDFINGRNLRELFILNRATEAQVKSWSIQLLSALEYLHLLGYIHRDINPKNILLKDDNVILIDFGTAVIPLVSGAQTAVGTEGYAPYEQKEAKEPRADERSDVFSLSATLYFLLMGHPPNMLDIHDGRIISNMEKSGVSTGLAKIVGTALNIDPSKRFQKATEMRLALQEIIR